MKQWWHSLWAGRPAWANALLVFCAYMSFVYLPWDLFVKPVAQDQEVWFGVLFRGRAAKLLALPHWLVYAAGFYGFLHMKRWMWPWAALYVAQVAFGMALWPVLNLEGAARYFGALAGLPFALLARHLWRARPLFTDERPPLRERYGEWALVTGASSGIGLEFARALAERGMNLVLSARREDRLREIAAELEARWRVSTRVAPADLSNADGREALLDALGGIEIGLVVANAGFGLAGRVDKVDAQRLVEMIEVNCVAPVELAARLAPAMLRRGRGAIVVTGSAAAHQPMPLHAVYAASKAFVQFFGEALAAELRAGGVDVLVLEPGRTETGFQSAAGQTSQGGEDPAQVVAEALAALGRRTSLIPGGYHRLRARIVRRLLPRGLAVELARDYMEAQTPPELR